MKGVCVIALVDNHAEPPLVAEHGLALWIEAGGARILFDTGQGRALIPNAESLGIDLRTTQHVVLSHGHYDHTGGLAAVLDLAPKARVCLHPSALLPKYSRQPMPPHRSIGMPERTSALLRSRAGIVWTIGPAAIAEGVTATGPIPRLNPIEEPGAGFFLDDACTIPDPLSDDQSLFIDVPDGIVLLLGCTHSGVINTCEYVRSITGKRIRAIIGGMHLLNADATRLDATVQALRKVSPDVIAPCHCTGEQATRCMREAFRNAFRAWGAGCTYEPPGRTGHHSQWHTP